MYSVGNMSDLELPIQSFAAVITEASVCVALSVTSSIGNRLVCIVAYRNTKLQSTTNLYVIALAVSDLLCETAVMPLASVTDYWKVEFNRFRIPKSRFCWYIQH